MVPTRIERSSWIDPRCSRTYWVDPDKEHHPQGGSPHLPAGVERVLGRADDGLEDAPGAPGPRNFTRKIGRRFRLYYNSPAAPRVVLRTDGATYWVVNTLLDRLSNETMIAVAKGLRPLAKVSKA